MYPETAVNNDSESFKKELRNLLIQEAIKLKKSITNLKDPNHLDPVTSTIEGLEASLKLFEIFANRLDML